MSIIKKWILNTKTVFATLAQSAIKYLKKKLEFLKAKFKSRFESFQTKLEPLKTRLAPLKNKIEHLKIKIASLLNPINPLLNPIKIAFERIKEYIQSINFLNNNLEAIDLSEKENTRAKKNKLISFFTILLSILIIYVCYRMFVSKQYAPPPLPVEASLVRVGPLISKIPAIGVLHGNESIILKSEVSGRIEQILFTEGEAVEKGTALFALDDSIAKAYVKEATAEYDLKNNDFKRAEILVEKGAGTIIEKESAYAKLQVAEANLGRAATTLSKMIITAPFEGYLGVRKVNLGDYVSIGQELVNLVDIDPIKVDFRVGENFLQALKPGQSIEVITDAFPNKKFEGIIYAIDPQIDPLGHSILIRATIDNHDHILKPGLFVKIHVLASKKDRAFFIPNEALMPQENQNYVYKLQNNQVFLTPVIIGERLKNEVEVISGLNESDSIVTAGQMKLQDQMKVTPLFKELNP